MDVWIGRDGQRHGPYPEADVRDWLRSGQVDGADLGWYEGLADWQPLSVLFPDARPIVPPPPPGGEFDRAREAPLALEDHAGFWKRLVAYIIDAIVLWLPNTLILKAFGSDAAVATMRQALESASGDPQAMMAAELAYYHAMGPAMTVTLFLGWLYFAACESSAWQGTVGKLAMGIRVTDLAGHRIGFWRAVGRYAGKFLSALMLGFGFLMVAWTRRKQGLHDMLANTLVLNGRAGAVRTDARRDRGSLDA